MPTGEGLDRESIRKTRSTLAQVLDFAGVQRNPRGTRRSSFPARNPRSRALSIADHVEAVLRLIPAKYVLPVLWLDWSAHRVTAASTR